jgi:hypothetical protein
VKFVATQAPDEWPYTVGETPWGQNPAYRPTGISIVQGERG